MAKYSNYRYNSKNETKIQELCEYILSLNYGEVIKFEKASSILGYNIEEEKDKKKFKSTMSRVKNFLIDQSYVLKSITGVGYYILKPKQISGYCYHTYIRRTQVLLEKSDRILTHVDTTELDATRMKEYTEIKELNENVYDSIGKTISGSKYEKHKNYYDSLKD